MYYSVHNSTSVLISSPSVCLIRAVAMMDRSLAKYEGFLICHTASLPLEIARPFSMSSIHFLLLECYSVPTGETLRNTLINPAFVNKVESKCISVILKFLPHRPKLSLSLSLCLSLSLSLSVCVCGPGLFCVQAVF